MSPASGGSGEDREAFTLLNNVLNLALFPGIVVHELAHALACRLVGVEVREVILFDWSWEALRANDPFTARVKHAPTESVWRALVIGGAPLLLNALGAFLAFRAVRTLLDPAQFGSLTTGSSAWAAYGAARADAGTATLVGAALAAWAGLALAMTAVPSVNDALLAVGAGLDADGGSSGRDRVLAIVGILLERFQAELSVVLTAVLAAVALAGTAVAQQYWLSYVAVFAFGVLYNLWRRIHRNAKTFALPVAESHRAERLRHQVESGETLSDAQLQTLIGQLDHERYLVRQATLRALLAAAEDDPSSVAPHANALVAHWDGEDASDCKLLLLKTLAELTSVVADRSAIARVAGQALADDRANLDVAATKTLAWLASEDPSPLADRVGILVDGLDHVEDDLARRNLAIAIAGVAAKYPDSVAPFADKLRARTDELDETGRDYVERTLTEIGG